MREAQVLWEQQARHSVETKGRGPPREEEQGWPWLSGGMQRPGDAEGEASRSPPPRGWGRTLGPGRSPYFILRAKAAPGD